MEFSSGCFIGFSGRKYPGFRELPERLQSSEFLVSPETPFQISLNHGRMLSFDVVTIASIQGVLDPALHASASSCRPLFTAHTPDVSRAEFVMIRPARETDHEALIGLAVACGLFEPAQTELLAELLRCPGSSDIWFTDELAGVPVGVSYLAPEKMTHGTWNLYWVAIHPAHQKQGRGRALLGYVETWLRERNQRLLIVETAGTEEFEYVRKFYRENGFEMEGRIRDFYDAGVDKIVFRKSFD